MTISGVRLGGTRILEGGRELPRDLPPFLAFTDPLGPFLCPTWFVSITFSSRDTVPIFYLIFEHDDPLFYCYRIILTPHFPKTLDLIGSTFFITLWTPLPNIW